MSNMLLMSTERKQLYAGQGLSRSVTTSGKDITTHKCHQCGKSIICDETIMDCGELTPSECHCSTLDGHYFCRKIICLSKYIDETIASGNHNVPGLSKRQ